MNKALLQHFQKIEQLSVTNPDYQRILDELFLFFVRNDHIEEDVTVQVFLPEAVVLAKKTGIISAKAPCVVSGVEEIAYLARKHTKLTPRAFVGDGKRVDAGTKIISLQGTAKDILAYERVFVNILQRMSGIATETAKYVEKVKALDLMNPPFIAATRKTPWMHVDKKAVAVGGGVTHRLDLKDGILLKDNHLELLSQDLSLRGLASSEDAAISYAISNANILDENVAIEVEVKTEKAAFAAVAAWQKLKRKNSFVILLDNFTPERAGKVIEEVCHPEFISGSKKMLNQVQHDKSDRIYFEASGGITLENIADFAKIGIDVISVGSLTHSLKAADLSMDIV